MKKILALLAAMTMLVFAFAGCGKEKNYDDVQYPAGDTLTLICPVAAGGEMDIALRIIANYLPKYLDNKNVVVENIVGGASTVAAADYLTDDVNSDRMLYLDTAQHIVTPKLQDPDKGRQTSVRYHLYALF